MIIDGYCTLGTDREYDLTADVLLAAMDTVGVDRAVIAPLPRQMAVRNREGNDSMLAAAAGQPRFIPACAVNPWAGPEGCDELKRAAGEGARMLVLDPAIQGFAPADELVCPLIEEAARCRLPVYVHTGAYHHGTPAQLGLLAQRFPDVSFIMGHCGSTDFKSEAAEVAKLYANIYSETSLTRPFGAVATIEVLGQDRVMMGSAAPLNHFVFEWRETLALLPPDAHAAFYGGTLEGVISRDR